MIHAVQLQPAFHFRQVLLKLLCVPFACASLHQLGWTAFRKTTLRGHSTGMCSPLVNIKQHALAGTLGSSCGRLLQLIGQQPGA